jgi:hypothetical protein
VLDTGAHIGATMSRSEVFDLPSFDPMTDKYRVDTFAALSPQTASRAHGVDSMRKPSWLLGLGNSSGNHSQKEIGTSQSSTSPTPPSTSSGLGYLEGGLRR